MTTEEIEILIADYYFEIVDNHWKIPREYQSLTPLCHYDEADWINRGFPKPLSFTKSLDWIEPVLCKMETEGVSTINIYLAYEGVNQRKEFGYGCEINTDDAITIVGFGKTRLEAIIKVVEEYILLEK